MSTIKCASSANDNTRDFKSLSITLYRLQTFRQTSKDITLISGIRNKAYFNLCGKKYDIKLDETLPAINFQKHNRSNSSNVHRRFGEAVGVAQYIENMFPLSQRIL